MRLVTVRTPSGMRAGKLDGDQVALLPFIDVGALLASGPEWPTQLRSHETITLADADLAPVVPHPRKIVCVGLNFVDHTKETGRPAPEYPSLFTKFDRALIGPCDPIELPPAHVSDQVDWEIELAVIIGREVRNAGPDEAQAAIAGFSVINDVSMRDWQFRASQVLAGKTFERCTPFGPALVTPDEIDFARNLDMQCQVDGEIMQAASTRDMVFSPAHVIEYLSTVVTLDPGDVITMGSPSGVGAGREPPVFLRPGQTLRSTIEGIGELVNPCRRQ